MVSFSLVLSLLLFASVCCASRLSITPAGVVNSNKLYGWEKSTVKPLSTSEITLGFAVKQNNLEKLETIFNEVSDPASPTYGQYLTGNQLSEIIGASEEVLQTLQQFLTTHGALSFKISDSKDYVWANFYPNNIESMLDVKLATYTFENKMAGKRASIVRTTDTPSLPSEIAAHLDFVSGVWHFPQTESMFKNAFSVPDAKVQEFLNIKEQGTVDSVEPYILQTAATNDSVVILFIPVCETGNTTESISSPCSDFGSPIASYNITTYQYNYKTNKLDVVSTIVKETTCYLEDAIIETIYFCSVNVSGLLVDSYVNVTLSYCFEDNTCSMAAVAAGFEVMSPVVPSAYNTPDIVRNHYNIPASAIGSSQQSKQSVAEFIYQFYSPADLVQFFQTMGLPNYQVEKLVGVNNDDYPGDEASLDIQYIMAVGQGVGTWFWYMEGNSFVAEWAQAVINTPNAPWVHSISYGEDEGAVPSAYLLRGETELQKMGVMGFSVIVSSGDSGTGTQCTNYTPDWPASSPYVTSVGATRITRGADASCQQNPGGANCSIIGEVSASGDLGIFWSTGSGISNANPRPSWQDTVVSNYLSTAVLPPSTYFNDTGRAYPDVAAVGHFLLVVDGGELTPIDGTSASAPIFAGIVALLNDARFNVGKTSPLGCLNPWIYSVGASNPTAFYDVTVGDSTYCSGSECCNTPAFVAGKGWDIVSGWGTPNFAVLVKEAVSLP